MHSARQAKNKRDIFGKFQNIVFLRFLKVAFGYGPQFGLLFEA